MMTMVSGQALGRAAGALAVVAGAAAVTGVVVEEALRDERNRVEANAEFWKDGDPPSFDVRRSWTERGHPFLVAAAVTGALLVAGAATQGAAPGVSAAARYAAGGAVAGVAILTGYAIVQTIRAIPEAAEGFASN
jgi:hypothetical protein